MAKWRFEPNSPKSHAIILSTTPHRYSHKMQCEALIIQCFYTLEEVDLNFCRFKAGVGLFQSLGQAIHFLMFVCMYFVFCHSPSKHNTKAAHNFFWPTSLRIPQPPLLRKLSIILILHGSEKTSVFFSCISSTFKEKK